MKKLPYIPKVGDVVRLNDIGLETIFGSAVGLSNLKLQELEVVSVEYLGGDIYEVDVNDPEISNFMTGSFCFDLIRRSNGGN